MKLDVRHLAYSVKGHAILHDVSFHAEGRSLAGIIGPNGCGKSTLLSHISRRLFSRQSVFLDEQPAESFSHCDYARMVAVMMQQREDVTAELLAEDVVLMGRYPYKERFRDYSAEDRRIVRHVMEETGAISLLGKEIGEMSGGERQRLWIAKALAQQPELLLLDEPTNHLDVKYKIALMEELKRFQGTAVIVLHDLSLAARYCDTVAIMKAGRIIIQGKTADVMTPERLSSVFDVPFYTAEHNHRPYIYY